MWKTLTGSILAGFTRARFPQAHSHDDCGDDLSLDQAFGSIHLRIGVLWS
jgi:hypothetical protein